MKYSVLSVHYEPLHWEIPLFFSSSFFLVFQFSFINIVALKYAIKLKNQIPDKDLNLSTMNGLYI
jgi:hypothetical protein